MRPIDWVALGFAALAALVLLFTVIAVIARLRWDRDFAHDKALLRADPSGDLWRERGRL